ncbi:MAG: terpene cyclase/mutase family protein [Clostridia bacterium]|nr:terpene cyclase/mutase family protein [Clostridia bacterium]
MSILKRAIGYLSLLTIIAGSVGSVSANQYAMLEKQLSVTVAATAVKENKFLINEQELSVSSDEAERFGYEDLLENGVSALDVLVKMHEKIYGKSFTPDNANEYLSLSGGWITHAFGEETSNIGYKINYMDASDLTQAMTDGEAFEFYYYGDTQYYSDVYLHMDDIVVTAGETASFTVNNNGMSLVGVQLAYVDKNDIIPVEGACSNDDGKIHVTFDRPGEHYITLYGTVEQNVTDWSTGGTVIFDSPIIPSVTKITAELPDDILMPDDIYASTAKTLQNKDLVYGSEWSVLGLARSGMNVPDTYYKSVMEALSENKIVKATDIEKTVIGLTASGHRADSDLLEKLSSSAFVKKGGIMSSIYALLTFDLCDYAIPKSSDENDQNTREIMIETILKAQKDDGGFSLSENWEATVDTTAMAVQALARYRDRKDVSESICRAMAFVDTNINAFDSQSPDKCSALAQVIIAYGEIDKNPSDYVKKMLEYYDGNGQFTYNGIPNNMATIQAYEALASYYRWAQGENSLYDMSDAFYEIVNVNSDYCTIYAPFEGERSIVKASYEGDILTDIHVINSEMQKGTNVIKINGGDKLMLWASMDSMQPMCEVY